MKRKFCPGKCNTTDSKRCPDMQQRLKLGVIFNFNPSWLGGIIYVINIIKVLDFLDDDMKPEVIIFYKPNLKRFLKEFNYPYLNLVEWTFPGVISGNILSWILGKNIFYDELIKKYNIAVVYPAKNFPVKSSTHAKIVAWYADLQHKHYPEFFSRLTIIHRNIRLFFMLRNASDLVVSSKEVKDDFHKFFDIRSELKLHVFHFVSINDACCGLGINDLRSKYDLPDKFFMVSNQFHKHKNHRILLLAIAKLKSEGVIKYLVITGKLPEVSGSPYFSELNKIISENKLQKQIKILGVIPRIDQLQIMKYSQAVLQPSLFEGWSTVIEDAISLNVPVIASNIKVNIEQLGDMGIFFDPFSHDELAAIIRDYPDRNYDISLYGDYTLRISKSASLLNGIFRQ